jgi:AraC-like DNA-binding protein
MYRFRIGFKESTHRAIDLADTLPSTIRHTSDRVNFWGARVLVRELPSVGGMDIPRRISHFWLWYRPSEGQSPMTSKFKGINFTHFANRSLLWIAPGTGFATEWKDAKGVVAHFQFHPGFLQEAAASLRLNWTLLRECAMEEVPLDDALESMCHLLMREVEKGCRHGSCFFESASRTLALALILRLVPARTAWQIDPRIAKALQFFEQRFREKVCLKEVARVAALSRWHFLRLFHENLGVTPHQYLIRCRLRCARQLIATHATTRSLACIAIESGFSDQNAMTRHFRREFCQTPGTIAETAAINAQNSATSLYTAIEPASTLSQNCDFYESSTTNTYKIAQ